MFIECTKYLEGIQRITQRHNRCDCGCQGQDPWHHQNTKRAVRDIVVLDEPHHAKSGWGGGPLVNICATGTYKHPSGIRKCGLTICRVPQNAQYSANEWFLTTWRWIDDDVPIQPGTKEEAEK